MRLDWRQLRDRLMDEFALDATGRTAEDLLAARALTDRREGAGIAAAMVAVIPMLAAVIHGADERNVRIVEVQLLARPFSVIAIGIALLCLASRWIPKLQRWAPRLGAFVILTATGFFAYYSYAANRRAVQLLADFPFIETRYGLPVGRMMGEALSEANLTAVIAVGFCTLAAFLICGDRVLRWLALALALAFTVFAVASREDRLQFVAVASAIVLAGALGALLRVKRAERESLAQIDHQRLKEREALVAFEHELELARAIQRSMAPPRVWRSKHRVTVASYYSPAQRVGGDWLAVHEGDDGALALVVADFSGSGLQGALVAHSVQSIWALSAGEATFDPMTFIRRVNATLHVMGARERHTGTMGIVALKGRELTYWSAAHGPLLLVEHTPHGPRPRNLAGTGGVLGAGPAIELQPVTTLLSPDLRTDLVLGSDRFLEVVRRDEGRLVALLDHLRRHGVEAVERVVASDAKTLIWAQYAPPVESGAA